MDNIIRGEEVMESTFDKLEMTPPGTEEGVLANRLSKLIRQREAVSRSELALKDSVLALERHVHYLEPTNEKDATLKRLVKNLVAAHKDIDQKLQTFGV